MKMRVAHKLLKWRKDQFFLLPTICWHDESNLYCRTCWFIEFRWLGLVAGVMLMKDGEVKQVGGWIWTSTKTKKPN